MILLVLGFGLFTMSSQQQRGAGRAANPAGWSCCLDGGAASPHTNPASLDSAKASHQTAKGKGQKCHDSPVTLHWTKSAVDIAKILAQRHVVRPNPQGEAVSLRPKAAGWNKANIMLSVLLFFFLSVCLCCESTDGNSCSSFLFLRWESLHLALWLRKKRGNLKLQGSASPWQSLEGCPGCDRHCAHDRMPLSISLSHGLPLTV